MMNRIAVVLLIMKLSLAVCSADISSSGKISGNGQYLTVEIENLNESAVSFLSPNFSEQFGVFAGFYTDLNGKHVELVRSFSPINVSPSFISLEPKEKHSANIHLEMVFKNIPESGAFREIIVFYYFQLNIFNPVEWPPDEIVTISKEDIGGYALIRASEISNQ